MQETEESRVQSLSWEDPLEKGTATHASVLAWRIPWTGEPGRLQPMGSQRVGHDWATSLGAVAQAVACLHSCWLTHSAHARVHLDSIVTTVLVWSDSCIFIVVATISGSCLEKQRGKCKGAERHISRGGSGSYASWIFCVLVSKTL